MWKNILNKLEAFAGIVIGICFGYIFGVLPIWLEQHEMFELVTGYVPTWPFYCAIAGILIGFGILIVNAHFQTKEEKRKEEREEQERKDRREYEDRIANLFIEAIRAVSNSRQTRETQNKETDQTSDN